MEVSAQLYVAAVLASRRIPVATQTTVMSIRHRVSKRIIIAVIKGGNVYLLKTVVRS